MGGVRGVGLRMGRCSVVPSLWTDKDYISLKEVGNSGSKALQDPEMAQHKVLGSPAENVGILRITQLKAEGQVWD